MFKFRSGKLSNSTGFVKKFIFCSWIPLSFIASSHLSAQSLTLGTGEFPPYISEKLNKDGPLSQIVVSAFAQSDYQVDVDFIPWNRAFKLADAGRLDGTFAWSIKADRQVKFLYSKPLFIFEQKAFALSKKQIDVSLNAAKQSVNLCRPQAYATQGHSKTLIEAGIATHFSPPDVETCFSMLKGGRVDIVVVDKLEGQNYVNRMFTNQDEIKTLDKVFYKYSNHLLISKAHPQGKHLIEKFNAGLDQIMASGEYQTILAVELGL